MTTITELVAYYIKRYKIFLKHKVSQNANVLKRRKKGESYHWRIRAVRSLQNWLFKSLHPSRIYPEHYERYGWVPSYTCSNHRILPVQ